MTQRESILAALMALFEPIPNCVSYRSREAALARNEGIAILVRPEEEPVANHASRLAIRDFMVVVTVIARGTIPDQVADPVIEAMHAAISNNQTLGGLVARIIEVSTKWDFEVADQNAVAVEIRYQLRYMTQVTTLSSLA